MASDETSVHVVDPLNAPDYMALLVNILLARLGGQATFTVQEIQGMMDDYLGMRAIYDPEKGSLVLTLRPRAKYDGPG